VYTRAIIEMALIGDPIVIKYAERGRVIGCITGTLQKDTRGCEYLFVNFLCVHSGHRKRGLANKLKQKLLQIAVKRYSNVRQMYAVYTISTDLQTGNRNCDNKVSVESFERVCQDEYYHLPINPDVFDNVPPPLSTTATARSTVKNIECATNIEREQVIKLLNSRSDGLYRMYTRREFTELFSGKCMQGYIIYDIPGTIVGFISYYKIYNRVLDITIGQVCETVGDKTISCLVESLMGTKEIDMLNYTSDKKIDDCGFVKGSSKLTWYTWGYKDTRAIDSIGLVSI
jgi:Acetyltransferase (GNAT) family